MSSDLRRDIQELWSALERIALNHEEVQESDVRENIAMVVHRHFVWGEDLDRVPVTYGMFSEDGDREVSLAVEQFLNDAMVNAEDDDVPTGEDRLDILQDEDIESEDGETFENFIAAAEEPHENEELPERFFIESDYEPAVEKASASYDSYDSGREDDEDHDADDDDDD